MSEPLEAAAVVLLQEAREELQQIQAQLAGAPQLQQELQPQVTQLREDIQAQDKLLATEEEVRLMEQQNLQDLRTLITWAEAELLSAGQLASSLAHSVDYWRRRYVGFRSNQIPLELRMQLGRWATRANLLLEQLAASLTADEIQSIPQLIMACASVGLSSSVKRMLQLTGGGCTMSMNGDPYLNILAANPAPHLVSFMPLLHFLRDGLDPTLISEQYPHSALHLARDHVQTHPLTSQAAKSLLQTEMDESGCGSNGAPHDFTMDYVTLQTAATWPEEEQRRQELHARFMHALMSAWRTHSSAVRALLLDAAPDRLIPDLVNICAEYLDLEPAEKPDQQQ